MCIHTHVISFCLCAVLFINSQHYHISGSNINRGLMACGPKKYSVAPSRCPPVTTKFYQVSLKNEIACLNGITCLNKGLITKIPILRAKATLQFHKHANSFSPFSSTFYKNSEKNSSSEKNQRHRTQTMKKTRLILTKKATVGSTYNRFSSAFLMFLLQTWQA